MFYYANKCCFTYLTPRVASPLIPNVALDAARLAWAFAAIGARDQQLLLAVEGAALGKLRP
eukprot:15479522-Alexandrium_andersonii.AAC.1